MFLVILMALVAIVMIWVLKNSDSNITTPPTTPDQTFENNVIEIPQDTDVSLEGLNIAPDTIPAR